MSSESLLWRWGEGTPGIWEQGRLSLTPGDFQILLEATKVSAVNIGRLSNKSLFFSILLAYSIIMEGRQIFASFMQGRQQCWVRRGG